MSTEEIGALLQNKNKLLSEIYFELQAACEAKYGPARPKWIVTETGIGYRFVG